MDLDFITVNDGKAVLHGSVAQKLMASKFNANSLRPWQEFDANGKYVGSFINVNGQALQINTTATLRKDEWKQYDTAVLQEARYRLVGVSDLVNRGLVYNIGNGMGKTVLEFETASDTGDAQLNMDGLARGINDRPEYELNYLPLPITHSDFSVNLRQLEASRNSGSALDTTIAGQRARRVAEKLESILFMGASSYAFGGGTIYGYVDAPNRNQATLNAHWNDSAATGATILDDVLTMKQALITDRFYGPYVVYVPTAYETKLDDDFKANSDLTIRQRLLQVGQVQDVKVADSLTGDNVVMVQMTQDVVRMVNGMPITTLQWDEQGGLVVNFKIITIQVPQIRSTQAARCGVCHATL